MFAFWGKSARKLKILFWDGNGLCLFTKRLDQGGFIWPRMSDPGGTVTLSPAQRAMLIEGIGARTPCQELFASDHLFADDMPVPVLDPGRRRNKTGRLWVYTREQRAWGGPEPPAAVYLYAPDRKAERPASHLEHFRGVLHV